MLPQNKDEQIGLLKFKANELVPPDYFNEFYQKFYKTEDKFELNDDLMIIYGPYKTLKELKKTLQNNYNSKAEKKLSRLCNLAMAKESEMGYLVTSQQTLEKFSIGHKTAYQKTYSTLDNTLSVDILLKKQFRRVLNESKSSSLKISKWNSKTVRVKTLFFAIYNAQEQLMFNNKDLTKRWSDMNKEIALKGKVLASIYYDENTSEEEQHYFDFLDEPVTENMDETNIEEIKNYSSYEFYNHPETESENNYTSTSLDKDKEIIDAESPEFSSLLGKVKSNSLWDNNTYQWYSTTNIAEYLEALTIKYPNLKVLSYLGMNNQLDNRNIQEDYTGGVLACTDLSASIIDSETMIQHTHVDILRASLAYSLNFLKLLKDKKQHPQDFCAIVLIDGNHYVVFNIRFFKNSEMELWYVNTLGLPTHTPYDEVIINTIKEFFPKIKKPKSNTFIRQFQKDVDNCGPLALEVIIKAILEDELNKKANIAKVMDLLLPYVENPLHMRDEQSKFIKNPLPSNTTNLHQTTLAEDGNVHEQEAPDETTHFALGDNIRDLSNDDEAISLLKFDAKDLVGDFYKTFHEKLHGEENLEIDNDLIIICGNSKRLTTFYCYIKRGFYAIGKDHSDFNPLRIFKDKTIGLSYSITTKQILSTFCDGFGSKGIYGHLFEDSSNIAKYPNIRNAFLAHLYYSRLHCYSNFMDKHIKSNSLFFMIYNLIENKYPKQNISKSNSSSKPTSINGSDNRNKGRVLKSTFSKEELEIVENYYLTKRKKTKEKGLLINQPTLIKNKIIMDGHPTHIPTIIIDNHSNHLSTITIDDYSINLSEDEDIFINWVNEANLDLVDDEDIKDTTDYDTGLEPMVDHISLARSPIFEITNADKSPENSQATFMRIETSDPNDNQSQLEDKPEDETSSKNPLDIGLFDKGPDTGPIAINPDLKNESTPSIPNSVNSVSEENNAVLDLAPDQSEQNNIQEVPSADNIEATNQEKNAVVSSKEIPYLYKRIISILEIAKIAHYNEQAFLSLFENEGFRGIITQYFSKLDDFQKGEFCFLILHERFSDSHHILLQTPETKDWLLNNFPKTRFQQTKLIKAIFRTKLTEEIGKLLEHELLNNYINTAEPNELSQLIQYASYHNAIGISILNKVRAPLHANEKLKKLLKKSEKINHSLDKFKGALFYLMSGDITLYEMIDSEPFKDFCRQYKTDVFQLQNLFPLPPGTHSNSPITLKKEDAVILNAFINLIKTQTDTGIQEITIRPESELAIMSLTPNGQHTYLSFLKDFKIVLDLLTNPACGPKADQNNFYKKFIINDVKEKMPIFRADSKVKDATIFNTIANKLESVTQNELKEIGIGAIKREMNQSFSTIQFEDIEQYKKWRGTLPTKNVKKPPVKQSVTTQIHAPKELSLGNFSLFQQQNIIPNIASQKNLQLPHKNNRPTLSSKRKATGKPDESKNQHRKLG